MTSTSTPINLERVDDPTNQTTTYTNTVTKRSVTVPYEDRLSKDTLHKIRRLTFVVTHPQP